MDMNFRPDIKPMYAQGLHLLKGNQLIGQEALTYTVPLESVQAAEFVFPGTVGHIVMDGSVQKLRLGLPAADDAVNPNPMPLIMYSAGWDVDVPGGMWRNNMSAYSHPNNPNPPGASCVVPTGGFELYAMAYDRDIAQYLPNTPLTASNDPAKLGLLTPGVYYRDIICGVVSRGVLTVPFETVLGNKVEPFGLAFWTCFQPRLLAATLNEVTNPTPTP